MQEPTNVNGRYARGRECTCAGWGVDGVRSVVGLGQTGGRGGSGESHHFSTLAGSETFDEQVLDKKYARKWRKIAN
jgi:hypothetical protein